jgi:hypothetical protein
MSDAYWHELASRELVPAGFRAVFDAAYQRMRARMRALSSAAPDYFPPARTLNVVVLRDPKLHAFFQPFEGMCALVYASDFDLAQSSVAHAEYQLVVAERVVQTRKLWRATLAALPHLLAMNEEEAADFVSGAERSTRPDRGAAASVAERLAELRANVETEGLREPSEPAEGFARVKGTPLVIAKSFAPTVNRLAAAVESEVAMLLATRQEAQQAVRPGDEPRARVLAYVKGDRPQVLIANGEGEIVWRPDASEATARLEAELPSLGSAVADSLIADLCVADQVTRWFYQQVSGAAELAIPGVLEEGGGVYLHHQARMIVYALEQPGLAPLAEEAMPYHRLNLRARTMHEWGHVAATAGLVDVPAARRPAFEQALKNLAKAFSEIVGTLSGEARVNANEELLRMREQGDRLEDLAFARLEDYRANLLMKRLMPPEVLEAYVRSNVRSLLLEEVAPLRKLARYAYEAQYLWLSGLEDPWDYFARSTYFLEEYVHSGFTSEEACKRLFEAMRGLCACYEVDATKVRAATLTEQAGPSADQAGPCAE